MNKIIIFAILTMNFILSGIQNNKDNTEYKSYIKPSFDILGVNGLIAGYNRFVRDVH